MSRLLASTSAALLAGLLLTTSLFSQAARALSPREQLQNMKAANEKLLEQQKATLEKLDVTVKDASQLRIFVRRN